MPMVGFGTWPMRGHKACEAVRTALQAGYRHVDTATMYANEAEVGQAVRDSGLLRQEVFLTTKLRASDAGRERAMLAALAARARHRLRRPVAGALAAARARPASRPGVSCWRCATRG